MARYSATVSFRVFGTADMTAPPGLAPFYHRGRPFAHGHDRQSGQRRQVAAGELPQVGDVHPAVGVEVEVGQVAGVAADLQVGGGEEAEVGDVHPPVAVGVPVE